MANNDDKDTPTQNDVEWAEHEITKIQKLESEIQQLKKDIAYLRRVMKEEY